MVDTLDEDSKGKDNYTDKDVHIVMEVKGPVFQFHPLAKISREELGPLVQVYTFLYVPFRNIGGDLRGPAKGIQKIGSDGNRYFRAISCFLWKGRLSFGNASDNLQLYYFLPRETECGIAGQELFGLVLFM